MNDLETHWSDLGIEPGEFQGVSLLLRDNHLVGQRLAWESAQATWFAEPSRSKALRRWWALVLKLQPLRMIEQVAADESIAEPKPSLCAAA
ncbi:MAG: hypothetical protein R3B96_21625 [Pirellulaceae bacterium]